MKKRKAKVDRRKHKRFRAQNGVFVIVRPSDNGACRLVNIGMGGLAFDYLTGKAPSIEATELEVFLTDSLFRLYDVPCRSIWDLTIYQTEHSTLHKRRGGVQFGELTENQVSQIEHFIENFTTGEA